MELATIPPSVAAIFGLALVGVLFAVLSARPYRGRAPTNQRPVVFVFSRVWIVGMNLLALFFLLGPYIFPDSPEQRAKEQWVYWLGPTLAILIGGAAEYLRRTLRVEVYENHFRFKRGIVMVEVRFAEVSDITVHGSTVAVRLHSGVSHLLSIGYGGTAQMLALLRAKISEARLLNPTQPFRQSSAEPRSSVWYRR